MGDPVAGFIELYRSLVLTGVPLDPAKVDMLERHLALPLPAAYRGYLLVAGASPPARLIGSDCHGDYLFELREWAEELLRGCGQPFEMPTDAVVFLMHQGYQFFYFKADDLSNDPPVWYYYENRPAPERWQQRFSEWVSDMTL